MAKRVVTSWRASTESVQGEGSWVEVVGLTLGEKKAIFAGEVTDEQIIREHIKAWNWADAEGNPLPQIPDDPSVVDGLIDKEISVLCNRVLKGDPAFDPNS